MKSTFLLFLTTLFASVSLFSQLPSYNGHPVIQANSTYTEYKIGDDWYKGYWSIAPHVEHDTLNR